MTSTPMHVRFLLPSKVWLGLLALSILTGCGSILTKPPPRPALFVLDDTTAAPIAPPTALASPTALATLVVNEPRAASGYSTRQITYVRTSSQLEYFAFNQWVEPPAVMLGPLLVRAVERTGSFRAVVRAPTSVAGDLRLDTELVRLQQDFTFVPSRVRLTLRAVLIDSATRRVVALREFNAEIVSTTEDPVGGVAAANEAAQRVLVQVGSFCAEWAGKPK